MLEPGEVGERRSTRDRREIGSVRIPALINELPYDLYSGYAISTDEPRPGGLDLAGSAVGDVSWTVGLRNLAYALQWWVFGAVRALHVVAHVHRERGRFAAEGSLTP